MEIDNGFKSEGQAPRRFYLNRMKDETGVSRTGRVLEGVLMQSGKVFVEWRPPHSTMGIYNTLEEFLTIHVDCHPSCNEVVWLDYAAKVDADGVVWYQGPDGTWGTAPGPPNNWHCFACGAGGNIGNFCCMCGSHAADYHGAGDGGKRRLSPPVILETGEEGSL